MDAILGTASPASRFGARRPRKARELLGESQTVRERTVGVFFFSSHVRVKVGFSVCEYAYVSPGPACTHFLFSVVDGSFVVERGPLRELRTSSPLFGFWRQFTVATGSWNHKSQICVKNSTVLFFHWWRCVVPPDCDHLRTGGGQKRSRVVSGVLQRVGVLKRQANDGVLQAA